MYDKVDPDDIQPYATAVQGRGEDIYVINTVISTAWTGIDLETYRCDRHYIEGYNFYCLKTGIAIGGGSRDGIVTDAQSNPWHNNRKIRTAPTNGTAAGAESCLHILRKM